MCLHKQRSQLIPIVLSALLLVSCPDATASEPFKVMSFNILGDFLSGSGMQWLEPDYRRDRVGVILDQEDADLIGFQEITDNQLPDLVNFLPEYDYVTASKSGIYNGIFFKRDRYQMQDSGRIDLTSGAAAPAAYTELLDKATNQQFVLLDVHLNPFDEDIRLIQAAEIQAAIPVIAGDLPVVLTGDFNFTPYDPHPLGPVSDHFLEITGRSGTQNRFLVDACTPLCGKTATIGTDSRRIDYIANSDDFQVSESQVVTTLVDGLRPSDHRPVVAELTFNPAGSQRTRWAVQSHVVTDFDSGSGYDGMGNFSQQSTSNSEWAIGRQSISDHKLMMKFAIPENTGASPAIVSAVLRIQVSDVLGDLPGGLSLMHSIDDNVYQSDKTDYQAPYADTGHDLIVSPGGIGQYYEFDVTSFVLADQLADGTNPLASFRLELPTNEAPAAGVNAAYSIDTRQFAPQLVITFVPEPSTMVLLVGAFMMLSTTRSAKRIVRRRGLS